MRSSTFSDAETLALQGAVKEELRRLELKPYVRSKAISVALSAGVTTVQHGLKRKPAGWLLHSILRSADARVPTAPDGSTISITSTLGGSCVLEVW